MNKFYVIPTPIGNLEDITLRTINVLEKIDYLYCEDTRVTKKLLNHLNIKVNLKTYNDYSDEKKIEEIKEKLNQGFNVGLVSDAGMPIISDPGYKLIKNLREKNYKIEVLPGPCAFITAVVGSGCKSNKMQFLGFLSKNNSKKNQEIEEILNYNGISIIYETPHQLIKTLTKFFNQNIKVYIARELTKIYEEHINGTPEEIVDYYQKNPLKGEFVVIFEKIKEEIKFDEKQIKIEYELLIENFSKKEVIKKLAKKYNVNKNEIYKLFID